MIPPESVPELLEQLRPFVAQVSEVQLLDFSTRAQYGAWAKFRYPDASALRGYETGQRFHLILIAIQEDEMPAANEGKERLPYKASQKAGYLCTQEDFRVWIKVAYGEDIPDKDAAAQWLRESCGITSRALLDAGGPALDIFNDIMRDYDIWKQQREGSNE